jgi:hypothetical protein
MSVICYVIINNILINNTENRRVFRGCEIDDVHMLLERIFKCWHIINSKHSQCIRGKTIDKKAPGFKYIYLNKHL